MNFIVLENNFNRQTFTKPQCWWLINCLIAWGIHFWQFYNPYKLSLSGMHIKHTISSKHFAFHHTTKDCAANGFLSLNHIRYRYLIAWWCWKASQVFFSQLDYVMAKEKEPYKPLILIECIWVLYALNYHLVCPGIFCII